MKVFRRWRIARNPDWDHHEGVVTDKSKVVWWLAVARFIGLKK